VDRVLSLSLRSVSVLSVGAGGCVCSSYSTAWITRSFGKSLLLFGSLACDFCSLRKDHVTLFCKRSFKVVFRD